MKKNSNAPELMFVERMQNISYTDRDIERPLQRDHLTGEERPKLKFHSAKECDCWRETRSSKPNDMALHHDDNNVYDCMCNPTLRLQINQIIKTRVIIAISIEMKK